MIVLRKCISRAALAMKGGLNTMPTESCFAASTAMAGKGDFNSRLD